MMDFAAIDRACARKGLDCREADARARNAYALSLQLASEYLLRGIERLEGRKPTDEDLRRHGRSVCGPLGGIQVYWRGVPLLERKVGFPAQWFVADICRPDYNAHNGVA